MSLWSRDHDPLEPLGPEAKSWLVGAVQARFRQDGEERTLPDLLFRAASSLGQVILGREERLALPELEEPCAG